MILFCVIAQGSTATAYSLHINNGSMIRNKITNSIGDLTPIEIIDNLRNDQNNLFIDEYLGPQSVKAIAYSITENTDKSISLLKYIFSMREITIEEVMKYDSSSVVGTYGSSRKLVKYDGRLYIAIKNKLFDAFIPDNYIDLNIDNKEISEICSDGQNIVVVKNTDDFNQESTSMQTDFTRNKLYILY